jgi:hypothetical protein
MILTATMEYDLSLFDCSTKRKLDTEAQPLNMMFKLPRVGIRSAYVRIHA